MHKFMLVAFKKMHIMSILCLKIFGIWYNFFKVGACKLFLIMFN